MKRIFAVILTLFLCSCTNSNDANKALSALGFTDIEVLGYGWFACSEDDWYHTKFIAKNAQGMTVNGVVCSGIFFKNSTVRF